MTIHDILFVPGLGDHHTKGQELLVASWTLYGVKPHMFRMYWNDGQYQPKLAALVAKIDELHEAGHTVSLVGASAGATAVINAFAARPDKVRGVVLIAGWVNYPESIGLTYRRKNPAFVDSALQVHHSLDVLAENTTRIQSRFGIVDLVVSRKHSVVPGANNRLVFSFGHGLTIASQLLVGAPFWIWFLKRLAK